MRAQVNQDECIGCGGCASLCPEVFQLGDSGKSTVISDPVPAEHEAAAKTAADNCPVGAISLA